MRVSPASTSVSFASTSNVTPTVLSSATVGAVRVRDRRVVDRFHCDRERLRRAGVGAAAAVPPSSRARTVTVAVPFACGRRRVGELAVRRNGRLRAEQRVVVVRDEERDGLAGLVRRARRRSPRPRATTFCRPASSSTVSAGACREGRGVVDGRRRVIVKVSSSARVARRRRCAAVVLRLHSHGGGPVRTQRRRVGELAVRGHARLAAHREQGRVVVRDDEADRLAGLVRRVPARSRRAQPATAWPPEPSAAV